MMETGKEKAHPGEEPGRAVEKAMDRDFENNVAAALTPGNPLLSPYLDAGLQLIPLHRWDAKDSKGRPRGKTPRDSAWQKKPYDSRQVAANAKGANVGVRLPANVVVLDVDPRNFPEGEDSLFGLCLQTGLNLDGVPHTRTGSGGAHYWFRKDPSVRLMDSHPDYLGVEFKSIGRQVVAAGSKHPCGGMYEWVAGLPDLRDLPPLPDEVLALVTRPTSHHAGLSSLGEIGPEELAVSLEHLDPCDFKDHDEWLQVMMACHHATDGEGRQEFIDWSTGDPKYAGDSCIIGRRWDSLQAEAPRGGKPLTIKYLHKLVQEAGGQVPNRPPEDDFDVWIAPAEETPTLSGVDAVVADLNAKHYVVMDNGFQIVTEKQDPVLKRVVYQRLSRSDFRSLYDNRLIEIQGKLVSVADVWMKSPIRRQYEGIIFDPERDHPGWLNLWKGWSVAPRAGDWTLLKGLVRDVLVDGDDAGFEYAMNWMAHMVQNPGKPAEVALCFRGEKGTGKGTLGRALADLAGASGLHISSPEHITGRFNSHLRNCILLFADEAFWAGDKAGESTLKQLVTEPTLTYEAKGKDLASGRNLIHIVMASNSEWMAPAGLGDERRFAMFDVNRRRQGDKPFFAKLNAQMTNGGLAAMLHELLARPLGEWHPRNDIPQNQALTKQKIKTLSQDPLYLWWLDKLETGALPDWLDENEQWASVGIEWETRERERVVELVNAKAKQLNRRADSRIDTISRFFTKVGVKHGKDKKGNRTWLVPTLAECRRAFDAHIGGQHEWED